MKGWGMYVLVGLRNVNLVFSSVPIQYGPYNIIASTFAVSSLLYHLLGNFFASEKVFT